MTEKFVIPYPTDKKGKTKWCKDYGLNAYYSGKHWSKRKQDADIWHMLVAYEMTVQKVRRTPFEKPVIISMYFNDGMDCSNHAAMFKMIEDAMKGRIIQDDTRKFVQGCEMYFHDKEFIKVVVREVEE